MWSRLKDIWFDVVDAIAGVMEYLLLVALILIAVVGSTIFSTSHPFGF